MKKRFEIDSADSTWNGAYSRFSHDEDKAYVMMLKEQGLPVLDDEFNLSQEMLMTHMRRTFLSILGDGSPDGGFQIADDLAVEDDFTIGSGYLLVDGWMINLSSSDTYKLQPETQGAMAEDNDGVYKVYLDVWFDEVDDLDDSTIKDPTLNIRTSCRLERKWAVKVTADAGSTPSDGVGGDNMWHWYYELATLTRDGSGSILSIVDARRELGMVVVNDTQTLTAKTMTTPRLNTPKINEDVTTDITSSELETLSDGGDADSLHVHTSINGLMNQYRNLKAYRYSTTTVRLSADEIFLQEKDTPTMGYISRGFSSAKDIVATASGALGLDTGVMVVGWYYIWAIGKTDGTVSAMLSLGKDAPTSWPSGYTYGQNIGAVYCSASTPVLDIFYQIDGTVVIEGHDNIAAVTSVLNSRDISAVVPETAKKILINMYIKPNSNQQASFIVASHGIGSTAYGKVKAGAYDSTSSAAEWCSAIVALWTPQIIWTKSGSVDTYNIELTGWEY